MDARIREDHVAPSTSEVAIHAVADPRDQALSHAVLQAVLDGDCERACCLAEKWRRLASNAPALRWSSRWRKRRDDNQVAGTATWFQALPQLVAQGSSIYRISSTA
jgi:hypothetical protein